MNYIVLDLEFNQPFNFKGRNATLAPECPFEIIQIGAVKLDYEFNAIDSFNFLVKPSIYKRLHPFVAKITGMSMDMLKNQPDFIKCFEAFIEFIGEEEAVLCTWGVDDIKFLYKNVLFYNLDTTLLSNKYINVQRYAAEHLKYDHGGSIGLKTAVNLLGLTERSNFHNALYDAEYTAEVLCAINPEGIKPEIFDITDLTCKNSPKRKVNSKALYNYFEKTFKHTLSEEEREIIKIAYKLGHNQTFDMAGKRVSLPLDKTKKETK